MSIVPLDLAHFTIPFSCVHDADKVFAFHAPLKAAVLDALREPLALDPATELHWPGIALGSAGLIDGATYRGALRINGVKEVTINKLKVERVFYSYVLIDEHDDIKGWSADLSAAYSTKPSWLWFKLHNADLEMTDARRAAIKSLAPKKPRAKKTP
jgi:hypothetical protein